MNFFLRINRLFRAMRPAFAKPNDIWATTYLPPSEYRVYANMDARDREHGVRVAQRLLLLKPDATTILIRAALLHDCGKQVRAYHWRERVWAGLQAIPDLDFDVVMQKKTPLTALEIRALHPQLGAMLIRGANGDTRVAEIVERHHKPRDDADAARSSSSPKLPASLQLFIKTSLCSRAGARGLAEHRNAYTAYGSSKLVLQRTTWK